MTTDGPVGINDPKPAEALSVRGNIQVTGTLLKPSDRRIKSDIVPVDTRKSLQTVRDLQVYDYKREDLGTGELVSERGGKRHSALYSLLLLLLHLLLLHLLIAILLSYAAWLSLN